MGSAECGTEAAWFGIEVAGGEPVSSLTAGCSRMNRPVYHRGMEGDDPSAGVAAFILAGGKSARMGSDKAFVMLDGRTLLERALELAPSVTKDVRVVGGAEKFAAFAPVVEDVFRECGPLGGIHAALRASAAELNLMLAVDVPFVPAELLRYLVARARGSDVFFFQAEDGIRDLYVTGVQTCALPICCAGTRRATRRGAGSPGAPAGRRSP